MEEQYVNFDTACMLKDAGFDVPCHDSYIYEKGRVIKWISAAKLNHNSDKRKRGDISRPTQALAARWLREKHKLQVYSSYSFYHRMWYHTVMSLSNDYDFITITGDVNYANYEDALEAGLQEAIKFINKMNEKSRVYIE